MESLKGFKEYHGEKVYKLIEEYIGSLKKEEDLSECLRELSIKEVVENKKPDKKVVKRKCGNCGKRDGHNKRTCKAGSKEEIKKEEIKKEEIKKEEIKKEEIKKEEIKKEKDDSAEADAEILCSICNDNFDKKDIVINEHMKYCLICYKIFLENNIDKCKDCVCHPCDCDTESLSDVDDNELLSDLDNDTLVYEGVKYYYDNDLNIIANNDYEEIGIFNKKTKKVEWYDDSYEKIHMNTEYYKK
jgi:hypothetical protein